MPPCAFDHRHSCAASALSSMCFCNNLLRQLRRPRYHAHVLEGQVRTRFRQIAVLFSAPLFRRTPRPPAFVPSNTSPSSICSVEHLALQHLRAAPLFYSIITRLPPPTPADVSTITTTISAASRSRFDFPVVLRAGICLLAMLRTRKARALYTSSLPSRTCCRALAAVQSCRCSLGGKVVQEPRKFQKLTQNLVLRPLRV
jgi:hypothetical protein